MKTMEHSAFPSDETLAAFIDGPLDDETRKRVVAHVADCDDCYGTLEAAGAWRRESEAREVITVTLSPRRNRSLIALAAAAAIGGVLLYQPLRARYEEHNDIAQLRDAANEMPRRVADARLSLDLSFQEKAPTMRGDGDEENAENLKVSAAVAQVRDDVRKKVVGEHTLGIAMLLDGDRDGAAKVLGKAITEETGTTNVSTAIGRCTDVALLNDLSAARGAVADFQKDDASRKMALDAAMRAWQLDRSPITAWNRAVALQRAGRGAAAAAWRDYLAIDGESRWSAEARDRLSSLANSR